MKILLLVIFLFSVPDTVIHFKREHGILTVDTVITEKDTTHIDIQDKLDQILQKLDDIKEARPNE